jgi:hypothetical protein
MADSVTSAFTEASEKTGAIFGNTHRMVFIALVVLLFLAINNIIIYLVYTKLRRTINNYCDRRIRKTTATPSATPTITPSSVRR